MEPTGELEAEALKVVGLPGVPAVKLKAAVGAWSGVMAMPSGLPHGDRRPRGVGGRGDGADRVGKVVPDIGGLAVGGDGEASGSAPPGWGSRRCWSRGDRVPRAVPPRGDVGGVPVRGDGDRPGEPPARRDRRPGGVGGGGDRGHRVRNPIGDVGGLAVGVMAMAMGPDPAVIGVPAVFVAVAIGVTLPLAVVGDVDGLAVRGDRNALRGDTDADRGPGCSTGDARSVSPCRHRGSRHRRSCVGGDGDPAGPMPTVIGVPGGVGRRGDRG